MIRKYFFLAVLFCPLLSFSQSQNLPVDTFTPQVSRFHGPPPVVIPCLQHQVAFDDVNLQIYFCSSPAGTNIGTWTLYSIGGGGGLPDPGANGIVTRTALDTTSIATYLSIVGLFANCSGTQYLGFDGQCHTPPGGGAGNPGGSAFQVQTNVSGTSFGGIANAAPGSVLASQGTSAYPAMQQKPVYDVRDFGFVNSGSTYNTTAAVALLSAIGSSPAKVTGPPGAIYGMGDFIWPKNVELDFTSGWQIQTITDGVTVPGNGVYDSTAGAAGSCYVNGTTTSCTATVTAVAGDTYAVLIGRGFSSGTITVTSNVASDIILPIQGSSPNFVSVVQAYYIPDVASGSHTFTCSASGNIVGGCSFVPISGLGPTPVLDGSGGTCANVSPNSPYTCSGSFTSGSFLLFVGSENNTAETCGAVGGGFTAVPGAPGCSTSTNSNMAVAYQDSTSAGTASPTIAFSPSPAGHYWSAMVFGLRPGTATNIIQGPIDCKGQCFVNAATGIGGIDFTGNLFDFDVYPEWFGASNTASATTNTAALQAAEHASFGKLRTNSSGLSIYNKPLHLDQNFQINGELKFYDVLNFKVKCDRRLSGGITQTASNLRIIDGQSIAYGSFDDCIWSGTASSNTWLIGLDYNGVATPGDLAPQFIDFNRNFFAGNGVVSSGVAIAPSGGAAQGSNIYCWNCEGVSFTFAVWQIGTTTAGATNAIDVGWYGGDMQGNPQFGIYSNAGGHVFLDHTTMENGFSATLGPDNQTGFDMYCQNQIGNEPCEMISVRSESRRLISAGIGYVRNSYTVNQAAYPTPGTSTPVGTIIMGSAVGGDGQYYKVTVDSSAFSGAGSPTALLTASSGSSTTLTDTNQTIAGSLTIGTEGATATETMTQAVSGATATRLNSPSSTGAIPGSLTSGATFASGDSATQATTGVTCTVGSGNSNTSFNCSNFSGVPDGTHLWTDTTISSTFTPSGVPVFTATTMLITAATGTPDSSHDWVGGTSGIHFTPTAVPANQAAWTVNAFNGQRVSIMGGTGVGCYGVITSNTATQLTFSAGFVANFNLACATPDTTSTFLVEPGWNGGTVVSGGITMVALNEKGIDGSNGNGGMQGILENVQVPGDLVNIAPTAYVKNLQVTRPDWLPSAGGGWWGAQVDHDWDVHLTQFVNSNSNTYYRNWKFSGPTLPTLFNGPLQRNLATTPLVWSCGFNGGLANVCNDVWIGGRSDPFATNTTSRNVLEFGGYLGRATPVGTNQNGTDTDIQGGLPTGSGTPGNINLRVAPGGGTSGATPQTSTLIAKVTPSGLQTGAGLSYTVTIFAGTVALHTNAINSGACDTTTLAASGVLTTDIPTATTQGDISAVTGYIPSTSGTLTIYPPWPSANQINFPVCNSTSSTITPGAVTLNVHVTR